MNEQGTVKTSSIVDKNVQTPQNDQMQAPTWFVIVFLIIALVVLKKFIYISDDKRHGK